MTRVKIVVEGQTEESFVKDVLAETLWPHQIYVTPIILGLPGHKGGQTNYARVKKDIILHLKQDRTAYCSTMLDFYGLGEGFPGIPVASNIPSIAKATQIEEAMKMDICASIPLLRPEIRFVPYIQLHEYEGLLFSDPSAFATATKNPHLAPQFQEIRNEFGTPEDINDNYDTAPSRRVRRVLPSYSKVLEGTLAARAIGINRMCEECPHFRDWIERLKDLAPTE